MNLRRTLSLLAAPTLATMFLAAACGSSDSGAPATSAGAGGAGGAAGGAGGKASGTGGAAGGAAGASAGGGATCLVDGDKGAGTNSPKLLGTDCDPISDHCGYPFPSNVYLTDDTTMKNPSGKMVRFGDSTLPRFQGVKANVPPDLYKDSDGFSAGQGPMSHMLGATATGLATTDTIPSTLSPDSPTILLDADSGTLIPHWVDIDMSVKHDEERAIIVRPAVRLKDKTRYIVAIRHVVDDSGAALPPTDAFKALRDGTPGCHPSVDLRRDLYKDIFAKLDAAGVKKDGMQVAWDYTTASKENNTRWLVKMRDEALANYGTAAKPFKWRFSDPTSKADENLPGVETPTMMENADVEKYLNLRVTLPLYLNQAAPYDSTMADKVPQFNFGADGMPAQNGEFEFSVLVHIPRSIKTAGVEMHGLLQNGHGLLGSRDEGKHGYLAHMANLHHYVAFATNLMGFDETDVPLATDVLGGSPEKAHGFIDRQVQGHLNQLLVMRFLVNQINDILKDPLVALPPIVDPTKRFYRGDSQGGIMGTTYMAVSTDVTRGLLGEPGMPYNLLLNRSTDYQGYGLILNGAYPNGLDVAIMLGLLQMQWDRSEPNGYAPYIVENMLPNTPQHQILIHAALGDCQVTPLGAELLARTVHAKTLNPAVQPIFGVDATDDIPAGGSGIVEYLFANLPPAPKTNTHPTACSNTHPGGSNQDPHDKVRELGPSYDQSDWFFRTGEIKPFCKGVCSCYDAMPEDGCDKFPPLAPLAAMLFGGALGGEPVLGERAGCGMRDAGDGARGAWPRSAFPRSAFRAPQFPVPRVLHARRGRAPVGKNAPYLAVEHRRAAKERPT